jgi:hypothetical protein
MTSVQSQIEFAVRLTDEEGALETLLATLDQEHVGVLAMRSCPDARGSLVLLVAADDARAERVLRDAGWPFKTTPVVVLVSGRGPGFAARLGTCLRDWGIGIVHSYASPLDEQAQCVVFKTTNQPGALRVSEDFASDVALMQQAMTERDRRVAA